MLATGIFFIKTLLTTIIIYKINASESSLHQILLLAYPPLTLLKLLYCSVPGKCQLPDKCPGCTQFQGISVTASIQTYEILILAKHPCGPRLRILLFMTRVTTVLLNIDQFVNQTQKLPCSCERNMHCYSR